MLEQPTSVPHTRLHTSGTTQATSSGGEGTTHLGQGLVWERGSLRGGWESNGEEVGALEGGRTG